MINNKPQLRIPKQGPPLYQDKWINNDRDKRNTFKQVCNDHSFCALTYDFVEEGKEKTTSRSKSLHVKNVVETPLQDLTEEGLDDWIFQSLNRPLLSLLDPKKKIDLPPAYLEEIKSRYYQQRISNKSKNFVVDKIQQVQVESKDYYFSEEQPISKKSKFVIHNGKSVLNPMNLLFDHHRLEPRNVIPGQPIQIREDLKLQKKKHVEQRRKAVYLEQDENYRKLEVELVNRYISQGGKKADQQSLDERDEEQIDEEEEEHLFSMNYDNYRRNRHRKEEVLTSFVQDEIEDISYKINKQKQIQQAIDKDFMGGEEQVTKATTKEYFQKEINETQIQLSKQHMQFKNKMENIVKDFKHFLKNPNSQVEQQVNLVQMKQKEKQRQSQQQQLQQQTIKPERRMQISSQSSQRQKDSRGHRRVVVRPNTSVEGRKRNMSIAQQMAVWNSIEEKSNLNININEMLKHMNNERGIKLDEKEEVKNLILEDSQLKSSLIRKKKTFAAQGLKVSMINQLNEKMQPKDRMTSNLNRIKNMSVQLLNSHSEERIIYNAELVSFSAHVNEFADGLKKPEQQLSQMEFWFNKGCGKTKLEKNEIALYCYKQALIKDPLHFQTIFNIAVIYEKIGKFQTSRKWFELALEFEKEQNEIKFGLALCYYKMGKFQASFQLLDDIINNSEEENNLHMYMRGLCAKRMYDLKNAAENYKIVQQRTRATNYELFVHFMFAVVYSEKRQMEIKFDPLVFCQFNALVTQVIDQELFIEVLSKYWNGTGWNQEEKLLETLKGVSFFKRFAKSILVMFFYYKHLFYFFYQRKFLKVMKLKVLDQQNVIFPNFDEVYIIVAGNVIVFDHREEFKRPNIIAFYKQGDILGCPTMDRGLSDVSDIWFVTQTPIEYISISKYHFDDLWKAQVQQDGQDLYMRLQKLRIFQGISILTLHKLAYEMLSLIKFPKNQIIFNDSSYQEQFEYIHLRKPNKDGQYTTMKWKLKQIETMPSQTCKLKKLIIKHIHKINAMKFTKQYIHGFYIIYSGRCEIENPNGFNGHHLTVGDHFGESLMFESQGFNQYGRIKAADDNVQCLMLSRFDFNKINQLDLQMMQDNCKDRPELKNIDYIYKRNLQIKELKKQRINYDDD